MQELTQKSGVPFHGTSKSAKRRSDERQRAQGKVHVGAPGSTIEMSRGRKYKVWADGSFRRLLA